MVGFQRGEVTADHASSCGCIVPVRLSRGTRWAIKSRVPPSPILRHEVSSNRTFGAGRENSVFRRLHTLYGNNSVHPTVVSLFFGVRRLDPSHLPVVVW